MTIVEAMKASKTGRVRHKRWNHGLWVELKELEEPNIDVDTDRQGILVDEKGRHFRMSSILFLSDNWWPYSDANSVLDKKISMAIAGMLLSDRGAQNGPYSFSDVRVKDLILALDLGLEEHERIVLSEHFSKLLQEYSSTPTGGKHDN